jgi:hypothetical protein
MFVAIAILTENAQLYYNQSTEKYGLLLLTDNCGQPQGNKGLQSADRLGSIWMTPNVALFYF